MKYFRQLLIILIAYFLGEAIHYFLYIPIPGNVLGMLLLFLALYTGIVKLEMIEEVSNFFLSHLTFFFLPAAVGLMTVFSSLKGKWTAIFTICITSTFIVMIVTAYVSRLFKRR